MKTKVVALQSCVDQVLKLQIERENQLIEAADFDAGLEKARAKCTKGYAKITAASTKFVDAVIGKCTGVAEFIVGEYDALRLVSVSGTTVLVGGTIVDAVVALAGNLCSGIGITADGLVGFAVPRMMEMLGYLGPEFVVFTDALMTNGYPKIPPDPRSPPYFDLVVPGG